MRNFFRKEDGGVAMIFALSIIPVLYFVGAAVDYRKLIADRDLLQSSADSAALSIATQLASYYANHGNTYPSSVSSYTGQ